MIYNDQAVYCFQEDRELKKSISFVLAAVLAIAMMMVNRVKKRILYSLRNQIP